jgi:hypothetical protein
MNCNYVLLSNVDKRNQDSLTAIPVFANEEVLKIWQPSGSKELSIQLQSDNNDYVLIQVYSINGAICQSIKCKSNEIQILNLSKSGIYLAKAFIGNSVHVKKFLFR